MKVRTIHARKHALRVGTLLTACILCSSSMLADEVTFAGTTAGSFSGATPSATSTDKTLVYNSSTFQGTTSNGYLAFGGLDGAGINFNNFGSFTLADTPATYSNDPFTLQINYTAPTGVSPGQSSLFTATVFGNVISKSNGGITVAFNPNTASYTFSNADQTGSFTLNLNNVSVNPGQSATITGYMQATATAATAPEPMSLSLLGTGLLGIAGVTFRRRSA